MRSYLILVGSLLVVTGCMREAKDAPFIPSGPNATFTVTERELVWVNNADNDPGVSLRLDVDGPKDFWELKGGSYSALKTPSALIDGADFNDKKLISVGFNPGYLKQGTAEKKKLYGVLEYDGPIFRKWFRGEGREWILQTESRLFAVDVGLDPEALRAKYPDLSRYAIVWAQLELYYEDYGKEYKPAETRTIYFRMLNNGVDLDPSLQNIFKGLTPTVNKMLEPEHSHWKPRYQATITFDKDYKPHILNLKLLSTSQTVGG